MANKIAALFSRTTYDSTDDAHYLRAKINESNDGLLVHVTNGGSGGTASQDEDTFTAGSTNGTPMMAYDSDSGELLVVATTPGTRKLAVDASVTVTPVTSTTISAADQETVTTVSETLLAANANRKRLILQNAGTTVLKFNYGASDPDQSVYHFALRPGGGANDASSPQWIDDMWKGEVRVISSAAGGLCNNSELT